MTLPPYLTDDCCNQIREICKNFFELTSITYFNFVRIYNDGSRIDIHHNRQWMKFVHKNHSQYSLIVEEKPEYVTPLCIVWDLILDVKEDSLIKIAREKFGIDHGVTLVKPFYGFVEFYYFATSKDREDLNLFYINNQYVLNTFSLYFKDKASLILKNAENYRITFPDKHPKWLKTQSLAVTEKKKFDAEKLFEICPIKKYILNTNDSALQLSLREAECLTYTFDGLSPKEIGKKLGISFRTVQGYIDNIKIKFSCSYKSDMLYFAKKIGFEDIYNSIKMRDSIKDN